VINGGFYEILQSVESVAENPVPEPDDVPSGLLGAVLCGREPVSGAAGGI
jgi:hypothetical protein